MDVEKLEGELRAAIADGVPFGAPEEEPKLELDATVIRRLLQDQDIEGNANLLWLRRVRIKGELDLSASVIGVRLRFQDCEFDGHINLRQASASDVWMEECVLKGILEGSQIDLRWNLRFIRSTLEKGLTLTGARLGGRLTLHSCRLHCEEEGPSTVALGAYGIRVSGDLILDGSTVKGMVGLIEAKVGGQLSANGATLEKTSADGALYADGAEICGGVFFGKGFDCKGEIRMRGAEIDGPLSFSGSTLEGHRDETGAVGAALNADGADISAGAFFREGFASTGELRFLGASIGGELSMQGASLNALPEKGDTSGSPLHGDRLRVAGSIFLNDTKIRGEIRLINAKIDGSLWMHGAALEGHMLDETNRGACMSADGIEVARNVSSHHGFTSKGELRFPGAKINGVFALLGAELEGGSDTHPEFRNALMADNVQVGGHFLLAGLVAQGEVRLPGSEIGGGISLIKAALSHNATDRGSRPIALDASRTRVGGHFILQEIEVDGAVLMRGVQVSGRVTLIGARLQSPPGADGLDLTAAKIDELVMGAERLDCLVNLREADVRTLVDAEEGRFLGALPRHLRLEGLRYRSLREPLDAEKRLRWIAPSQESRHYPGVYNELAAAFRRIGHMGDARKIAIANERRARQDAGFVRRIGHDLLWLAIGYGYRNALAALWLIGLIAVGSALFAMNDASFTVIVAHPPPFNPLLYAVDVTIPVLDLGQSHARSADGCMAWVALTLAISGYGLAAAVIAAAAGVFNRDQS